MWWCWVKPLTPEQKGLIVLLTLSLFISSFPQISATPASPELLRTIDGYRDYQNITDELVGLSEAYPSLLHLESLGKTWEGRNIWAVKISDSVITDEEKPEVLVMGGHHGNELPAADIPLRFIEFLVSNYGKNLTVTRLVDTREIWVIPLVNPDGYEYSIEGHDWRKNRRPIDLDGDGIIDGTGVDLNRNYGYRWGEEVSQGATSHDPTSRVYCGPSPFSENETRAVRSLVQSHNFTLSMSFHTYGQVIYYPWGNAEDANGPRQKVLEAMAGEMADLSGYTPMEGRDAYATTGDSDDWLFANRSCLPFTIEMGTEYIVPPNQLEPMFERILPAMTYAIDMARDPERALLSDWTIMSYMSGDNSLSDQVGVDLNEMEAGMTDETNRVNLIALADTAGDGDTHLYHLEYRNNSSEMAGINASGVVPSDGEADMSSPSTLSDFINWSVRNYPAQRFMLVLWGHGGDIFTGIGPDKGKWLGVEEIRNGLRWSGVHMNIIGFDACYMGSLEIYSSLSPYTDIVVSSQVEEQEEGWNYTAAVKKVVDEPYIGEEMLASFLVDSYAAYYSDRGDVAMAAVDTYMLSRSFMPAFEAWASLMERQLYAEYPVISRIRNASVPYYGNMLDLDTMLLLMNSTTDASKELRDAAEYLLERSRNPFIREYHSHLHNIKGLGLYFADGDMDDRYPSLFSSRWVDFVREYAHPVPYPLVCEKSASRAFPSRITVNLSDSGYDAVWSPLINSSTRLYLSYSELNPFLRPQVIWNEENMTGSEGRYTATIPGKGEAYIPEAWYSIRMESLGKPFFFPWNSEVPVLPENHNDGRFYNVSMKQTADIGISSVSLPETAVLNVPFLMNVTLKNSGSTAINCTLSFSLSFPDRVTKVSGSRQVSILGESMATITFHITPLYSGNATISITASPQNSTLDPDMSNNTASLRIWVDGDMDGDGIGDSVDADRDGDGYSNDIEVREGSNPDDATSTPPDNDKDGIPDDIDPDDDNDGFPDSSDAFPLDPGAHYNPVPMLSVALVLVLLLVVMLILRHRRLI